MTMPTANGVIEQQNAESHDAEKNISAEPRRADDGERRAGNEDQRRGNNDPRQNKQPRQNNQPRRDKRDVHGWVVLDKPIGMTSTHAVAVLKRLFQAKRAGHAGTLDPLASGGLPIALGRSHQDGPLRDGRPQALPLHGRLGRGARHRRYRGAGHPNERTAAIGGCDPRAAAALHRRDRADPAAIFSDQGQGERAYDLARDGETVELKPRPVEIHELTLVEHGDEGQSVFEAECGKGTYVRALARDIGRILGCFGHICALRRTLVGPFPERDMNLAGTVGGFMQ